MKPKREPNRRFWGPTQLSRSGPGWDGGCQPVRNYTPPLRFGSPGLVGFLQDEVLSFRFPVSVVEQRLAKGHLSFQDSRLETPK